MELVARAQGDAGDLSKVVPAGRDATSSAPPVSLGNVIPFVRPRREAAPTGAAAELALDPAARPAPPLSAGAGRARIAALLALSLAAHCGLYILFTREPEPLASIGLEAISVEFVLGANTPTGPAPTPGRTPSAPADDPTPTLDPDTTVPKAEEARPVEAKVREPQQLAETAVREVRPDRPRSLPQTPPEELKEQAVALLRGEETPAAREPELTTAPVEPAKPVPAEPEPTRPVRTETRPQPRAAPKHETRPKQERDAKPKQRPGPPQQTASREPNPTGPHQNAPSGVGLGRSQLNSNYRGMVFAHLARHKRFPPRHAAASTAAPPSTSRSTPAAA